mgnify:CR=1 FL=1
MYNADLDELMTDVKNAVRTRPLKPLSKTQPHLTTLEAIVCDIILTLLLLVFALLGKNKTLKLYKFAINKKLRFFSYGDACLIWNKNDKF